MELRPYQHEALAAVYRHLRERDDNPCVVLPTGTGKGFIIGQVATDATERWNGRVIVLAHVKELLEQNAEKIQKLCPGLDVGIYSAGLNQRDTEKDVIVAGIQSVYKRACELGPFDLAVVDEAHLIPPDGEGMYRTFLADAATVNPNLRVIGLTATPFRLKGGLICKPENILNHVCYEAGIKEMIVHGYLSPLKTRAGKAKANLEELHIRGGEFIASEVEEAMDRSTLVRAACEEIVELTRERKAVLIFTSGVAHCQHVASEIRRISGEECGVVTGDTPSAERADLLARFRGETTRDGLFDTKRPLKFLANVNVLTTGFDATNVDCVALLRPTNSPGLYVQMCLDMETEILTPRGWARCDEVELGDIVGAFDLATSEIVWSTAKDKVHRMMHEGESMFAINAPHLDIRVTDRHTMIYRGRSKTCVRWRQADARDLSEHKDSYYIPIAGENDAAGIALTDDDIRFIGWALTDGHRNPHNNAICISQSANSPYNEAIATMLEGCGFGYRRYRKPRKGEQEGYADAIEYVVPYGQPRGENAHLRGWKHLADYFNNPIGETLESISQRQLAVLLEAMNLADGSKRRRLDWTPRTYQIAIGPEDYLADGLQSLLIRRGYRCNISIQRQKGEWHSGKPKALKILHIRKQTRATVGGSNSRPSSLVKNRCGLKPVPFSANEMVWCVTTEQGAIVTRRNGKVAVLGNCGRGTRLHPGKEDCLVLDFGGNVLRHGPVDAIRVQDEPDRGGKAPAKECPECSALIHAAYQVCPECGFQFPERERTQHGAEASTADILSKEVTLEERTVERIYYAVHTKRNAPPDAPKTMRVDYQVGWQQSQSEWVCFEHDGYARKKAESWWRERSHAPIPSTAAEAVSLADNGALCETQAITIRSVSGEKYDRIVGYDLGEKPDYREPGWDDVDETFDDAQPGEYAFADEEIPF